MKFTPRKYACALAQTLEETKDQKAVIANLLHLLRRRKHSRLLPKILKAFEEEWSRRRGVVRLDVTYPEKFQDSLKQLEDLLREKLGRDIEVRSKSSPTLIGGFRLQVEDTLIDASLESRLRDLSRRLNN